MRPPLLFLVLGLLFAPGVASAQLIVRPWADGAVALRSAHNTWLVPDRATWAEAALRGGAALDLGPTLHAEAGAVLAVTLGQDASGVPTRLSPSFDRLFVSAERLAFGHVDVSLGRQALRIGDGFLVADGVSEPGLAVAGALGKSGWPGAGQLLAPLSPFDALSVAAYFDPLRAQAFVARLSPTFRYDELGTTATGFTPRGALTSESVWWDGTLMGADLSWEQGAYSAGFTPLVVHERGFDLRPEGRLTWLSFRGGAQLPDAWSVRGEASLERGSQAPEWSPGLLPEDLSPRAVRAFGGYVEGRREWRSLPLLPTFSAAAFLFSGDNPDTAADERWHPPFSPTVDLDTFTLGDLAGRAWAPNTDRIALRLRASASRGPHQLVGRAYGLFTHWGSDLCQEVAGVDRCVLKDNDYTYTLGRLSPAALELDLAWEAAVRALAEGAHVTAGISVLEPLKAVTQPASPGGDAVVGDFPSVAFTVGARAAW